MENKEAHPGQQTHTIPRHGSGRWIIHLFLTFFLRSVTTAILALTVGLLPLRGLAVSSLSFPVMMTPCRNPTFITAVGLTPKTTPADTEKNVTPLALDLTQQQNRHPLSDLQSPENRRILLPSVLGFLDWLSKKKARSVSFGPFIFYGFPSNQDVTKNQNQIQSKSDFYKMRRTSVLLDIRCLSMPHLQNDQAPGLSDAPSIKICNNLDML
jgi:hypothetical protein